MPPAVEALFDVSVKDLRAEYGGMFKGLKTGLTKKNKWQWVHVIHSVLAHRNDGPYFTDDNGVEWSRGDRRGGAASVVGAHVLDTKTGLISHAQTGQIVNAVAPKAVQKQKQETLKPTHGARVYENIYSSRKSAVIEPRYKTDVDLIGVSRDMAKKLRLPASVVKYMERMHFTYPSTGNPAVFRGKTRTNAKQLGVLSTQANARVNKCENVCSLRQRQLTEPQIFLGDYYITPASPYNVLAMHDVGTGKTCLGLRIMSNFARHPRNYNLIWVSKSSILSKAVSDRWCYKPHDIAPEALKQRINFWSYLEFRNFLVGHRKATFVQAGVDKQIALGVNGHKDKLRNAVLIIDEPHLLLSQGGLSLTETGVHLEHDQVFKDIADAVKRSHATSDEMSARVVLMTATPQTTEPMSAIRLLNLLNPREPFPEDFKTFTQRYMERTSRGKYYFSKQGSSEFKRQMTGLVSVYTGSSDPGRFAQVVRPFTHILVKTDSDFFMGKLLACGGDEEIEHVKESGKDVPKQVRCLQMRLAVTVLKDDFLLRNFIEMPIKTNARERSIPKRAVEEGYVATHQSTVPPVAGLSKRRSNFIEEVVDYSPKVAALYQTMQDIDRRDAKMRGKLYKHLIISTVPGRRGTQIIASMLAAKGHALQYAVKTGRTGKKQNIAWKTTVPSKNGMAKFVALTRSKRMFGFDEDAAFDQAQMRSAQEEMFAAINNRKTNSNGDFARYIILDGTLFLTGIDMFDIKYIHLFEPQKSSFDTTQALGRALRMCGQCGIDFVPNRGWELEVFEYDIEVSEVPEYLSVNRDADAEEEENAQGYGAYIREHFTNTSNTNESFGLAVEAEIAASAVDKGFYGKEVLSIAPGKTCARTSIEDLKQLAKQRNAKYAKQIKAGTARAYKWKEITRKTKSMWCWRFGITGGKMQRREFEPDPVPAPPVTHYKPLIARRPPPHEVWPFIQPPRRMERTDPKPSRPSKRRAQ